MLREAPSILGLLKNLKNSKKEDTVDVDIGGGKVVKAETYKGIVVGVVLQKWRAHLHVGLSYYSIGMVMSTQTLRFNQEHN